MSVLRCVVLSSSLVNPVVKWPCLCTTNVKKRSLEHDWPTPWPLESADVRSQSAIGVVMICSSSFMILVLVWPLLCIVNLKTRSPEHDWPPLWPLEMAAGVSYHTNPKLIRCSGKSLRVVRDIIFSIFFLPAVKEGVQGYRNSNNEREKKLGKYSSYNKVVSFYLSSSFLDWYTGSVCYLIYIPLTSIYMIPTYITALQITLFVLLDKHL